MLLRINDVRISISISEGHGTAVVQKRLPLMQAGECAPCLPNVASSALCKDLPPHIQSSALPTGGLSWAPTKSFGFRICTRSGTYCWLATVFTGMHQRMCRDFGGLSKNANGRHTNQHPPRRRQDRSASWKTEAAAQCSRAAPF